MPQLPTGEADTDDVVASSGDLVPALGLSQGARLLQRSGTEKGQAPEPFAEPVGADTK